MAWQDYQAEGRGSESRCSLQIYFLSDFVLAF